MTHVLLQYMVWKDFVRHSDVLALVSRDFHVPFHAMIDNHRLQLNYEWKRGELYEGSERSDEHRMIKEEKHRPILISESCNDIFPFLDFVFRQFRSDFIHLITSKIG